MTRVAALMLCILTAGHAAADDVLRCTDSAGKVLYANAVVFAWAMATMFPLVT